MTDRQERSSVTLLTPMSDLQAFGTFSPLWEKVTETPVPVISNKSGKTPLETSA
jgi:hypothetical protein